MDFVLRVIYVYECGRPVFPEAPDGRGRGRGPFNVNGAYDGDKTVCGRAKCRFVLRPVHRGI